MNEEFAPINQMRAVTISREYGSGGGEIASRLARRLGWHLIDHAIVERVASEIGTSTQEAEVHDEHVQGMVSQALGSLLYLYPWITDCRNRCQREPGGVQRSPAVHLFRRHRCRPNQWRGTNRQMVRMHT